METTTEKIKKLRQEIAELEQQERVEIEEARKQVAAERDKDLLKILDCIKDFNKKYGKHISLAVSTKSEVGRSVCETFFPWIG